MSVDDKGPGPVKDQIAYLSKIVVKETSDVRAMVVNPNTKRTGPVVEALQNENWYVKGEAIKVHRVFVGGLYDLGEYSSIGWIMACDVINCMICYKEFNTFNSKYNCFACGNVVCSDCSPDKGLYPSL